MSWVKEYKAKVRSLEGYATELEEKLQVAVRRLTDLSVGLHYPSEVDEKWSLETKAQVTAAKGLEKIARMPQRRRPYL